MPMTRLTRQMQRYLLSVHQNDNWLIRVLWSWKVLRMTDKEVIDTYHVMTTRR